MLTIRPGHSIEEVHDHLEAAWSKLVDVQNTTAANERALAYFRWGGDTNRTLGSAISERDIEHLVLTTTYWHLLPIANFDGGRFSVLDVEIQNRLFDLQEERQELARRIDDGKRLGIRPMAVIDTNVVMTHYSDLGVIDWHRLMGVWPHESVRVVIPILVIDELDRLKRSQGNMVVNNTPVPRRTVARRALRTLEGMFRSPAHESDIGRTSAQGHFEPATLGLLMDPIGHSRLDQPDAEIRDRALSARPYVSKVVLFTYDLGNQLAANVAGLEAVRLVEEDDE